MTDRPRCVICGKPIEPSRRERGGVTCGAECSTANREKIGRERRRKERDERSAERAEHLKVNEFLRRKW